MTEENKLKGLRGWLILVGIGVVLSPFKLAVTMLPLYLPIFQDSTWGLLTTPGSPAYNPLWAPLLVGEIGFNSLMFIANLGLIYLFFSKHYLFPRLYIGVMLASLVFIPLDASVVSLIMPDEPMFDQTTTKEFLQTLIGSLIWIPYMLRSRRVKATFVNGRKAATPQ